MCKNLDSTAVLKLHFLTDRKAVDQGFEKDVDIETVEARQRQNVDVLS